jgi:hypothetical protein
MAVGDHLVCLINYSTAFACRYVMKPNQNHQRIWKLMPCGIFILIFALNNTIYSEVKL